MLNAIIVKKYNEEKIPKQTNLAWMGDQVANHLTVGLVKSIKYAYTKYQISLFSLMLTIREKENKVTKL